MVAEAVGAKLTDVRQALALGAERRRAEEPAGDGGSGVADRVLRCLLGSGLIPHNQPASWPRGQVVGWAGMLLAAAGGFFLGGF